MFDKFPLRNETYSKNKIKEGRRAGTGHERGSEIIVLIARREVRKLSCSREFKTRTPRITCIR